MCELFIETKPLFKALLCTRHGLADTADPVGSENHTNSARLPENGRLRDRFQPSGAVCRLTVVVLGAGQVLFQTELDGNIS